MRLKSTWLAIFMVLVFSVSCIAGCAPKPKDTAGGLGDEEIRIGIVLPLSGIFATIADEVKRGHDLAAELINSEGGVLGKPVRLIYEDDRGEPSLTMEKARKLVEVDKVHVLAGTVSSATTLAVIPVAEELKVPFIYGMEGELKTTKIGNRNQVSDYVIGCGATPEQAWIAAIDVIMEHGNRFYFIGSDYVYPRSFNAAGITRLEAKGAQVVGEEYIPLGTTDYSALIAKLESLSPQYDVLWSTLVGSDAVAFAKQAREFGLLDSVFITGMAQFAPGIFPGMAADVEGVYCVNLYSEDIKNPENEVFLKMYKERYDPEWPIAAETVVNGWATQMLLRAGFEKAGKVDRVALIQALKGISLDLPNGTVYVNPKNNIVDMPIYWLQIRDGGFRIVKEFGAVEHPGFEGSSVP